MKASQESLNAIDAVVVGITGANGFLGSNVIALMQHRCTSFVTEIVALDIVSEDDFLQQNAALIETETTIPIQYHQVDITKPTEVLSACSGVDVMFHTCDKMNPNPTAKEKKEMFKINVEGTRNIVDACKALSIPYLVYTSSTTVDSHALQKVDVSSSSSVSSLDFNTISSNFFAFTKSMAETLVIEANGTELCNKHGESGAANILKTCALRLPTLYGGRGNKFVPKLISICDAGFGYFPLIGWNPRPCSHLFVENAAWAHICAAKALIQRNGKIIGKVHHVVDDTPTVDTATFFKPYGIGLGYNVSFFYIPLIFLYYPLAIFRFVCRIFGSEWFTRLPNPDVLWETYYWQSMNGQEFAKEAKYRPVCSAMESFDKTLGYYVKKQQEGKCRGWYENL